MNHYRSLPLTAFLGAALGVAHAPARANDCGFSVDFEDFRPELRLCGADFELKVKYEIEFDRTSPADQFALILRLSECGRPLVDANGEPVTFVVPLDCPKKWKGKDRDYEATVRFSLPAAAVRCPDDVRVQGTIVRESDNAPLACRDKKAKFDGGCYVECRERVVVAAPAPVVVAAPPPVVYVEPAPQVVVSRPVVVTHARPVVVTRHYRRQVVHRPVAHQRVIVQRHDRW